MSKPDIVQSMRGAAVPVRQTGFIDILLGLVALLAVGALGYFGVSWWTGQTATTSSSLPPTPAVVTASLGPSEPWTDRDTAGCEAKGRAAARKPITVDALLANPSVTEGFANMATVVACKIATKADRFCDPTEKAALVAMVNDYVSRVGLIVTLLNLEGAPMNMMSGMNGEVAAGADFHNLIVEDTVAFMKVYHRDIADGLKGLARDGVITVGDFGAFMGMGVPPMVKEILEGVERTGSRCG